MLWFELLTAFKRAYDASPRDESLIARVYRYADWCMAAPRSEAATDDLFTCTCVCFYEHIPQHLAARADMPRWITYDEFIGSEEIFGYFLTAEEFVALKQHFYEHRHDFVPRPTI